MTEELLAQHLESPSGTGRDDPENHQPTTGPRTTRGSPIMDRLHSHWAFGSLARGSEGAAESARPVTAVVRKCQAGDVVSVRCFRPRRCCPARTHRFARGRQRPAQAVPKPQRRDPRSDVRRRRSPGLDPSCGSRCPRRATTPVPRRAHPEMDADRFARRPQGGETHQLQAQPLVRSRRPGRRRERPRSESRTPPGGNSHRATRRRFRAGDDMVHEVANHPLLAWCWPRPLVVADLAQPAFELSLRQLDRLYRVHRGHPLYSAPPAQSSATASCRRPAHNCRSGRAATRRTCGTRH